jgi:hypothetical protein
LPGYFLVKSDLRKAVKKFKLYLCLTMNKVLTTLLLLFVITSLRAQEKLFKGPVVYAEADGGSFGVGLNAEMLLFRAGPVFVNGRIGFGAVTSTGFSPCVPASVHAFFLNGNHHPEF